MLQRHRHTFLEEVRFLLTARAEFMRQAQADPATLTDIERAARFIYLLKAGFGGKVVGRSFGVDTTSSGRFDPLQLMPAIEALHARLAGVTIENLGYAEFMERYDRPHTLFYLDPPYYGCEGDYGKNLFSRGDFHKIAAQLQ